MMILLITLSTAPMLTWSRISNMCLLLERVMTATDFWNFFALHFALCVVNYAHVSDAWQLDVDHLFGNTFFRNKMSRNWFFTLHRCLQADISQVTSWFNQSAAKYWIPSTRVCVDDQLDKFFGHDQVTYIPKKMARTGIPSWEIVDQHFYCYHLLWHSTIPKQPKDEFATRLRRKLLNELPQNSEVYIDAGILGSFETALELGERGHNFLISCAANRPHWLCHKNKRLLRFLQSFSTTSIKDLLTAAKLLQFFSIIATDRLDCGSISCSQSFVQCFSMQAFCGSTTHRTSWVGHNTISFLLLFAQHALLHATSIPHPPKNLFVITVSE